MSHPNARFEQVADLSELDDAIGRSNHQTVVLFNHDPWCPISARAYRELQSVPVPVMLIDVSRQRDVTSELSRRTGVRHESPQVLIIRHGEVKWSASHTAISGDRVMDAAAGVAPE